MQINDAFVLRNIYGKYILMPVCSNSASNDPILLNEVAASIWKKASIYNQREKILKEIGILYGIGQGTAEMLSVDNFISQMLDMGLLLEGRKNKYG